MKTLIIKIMLLLFTLILSFSCFAQDPGDPPPPPGGHGQQGNQQPGGGAPVGGGIGILVALGVGYGLRKWYVAKRKRLLE